MEITPAQGVGLHRAATWTLAVFTDTDQPGQFVELLEELEIPATNERACGFLASIAGIFQQLSDTHPLVKDTIGHILGIVVLEADRTVREGRL